MIEKTQANPDRVWIELPSRLYAHVENLLNAVSALSITVLMLFAVVQVVGRKIFNAPIFGYIDWVEQIMVLFAFIGVAYCQREGGHVRMELIISGFRRRLLWLVEVVGVIIGLFIIGVIPVVNLVAAVLWFVFNCWMMSLQYVDYPADNHRVSFPALRRLLGDPRLSALGFGLPVALAAMVPVLNLVVVPAAVCGATAYWVRENGPSNTDV